MTNKAALKKAEDIVLQWGISSEASVPVTASGKWRDLTHDIAQAFEEYEQKIEDKIITIPDNSFVVIKSDHPDDWRSPIPDWERRNIHGIVIRPDQDIESVPREILKNILEKLK